MRNYITVAFNNASEAYDGQHALWELDSDGSVTVHGTAVVHRDSTGQMVVDTRDDLPAGIATAFGVGIGTLIGALAGPAGAAIGATEGAALGAAAGGSVGLVSDAARDDIKDQAAFETGFELRSGQHAVIADVSEDWTTPVDTKMQRLGGKVFRRSHRAIRDDAWSEPMAYDSYLYPYEYRPNLDTVG